MDNSSSLFSNRYGTLCDVICVARFNSNSCFTVISIVKGQVDLSTLTELGRPSTCSSPGWRNAPYDISTLIGSYVNFNCRSSISHSQTVWLYNGKQINMTRGTLSHDNSTLRYGPITESDGNVAIGCEVMTHFGVLPSPQGKIAVMGEYKNCICLNYSIK